VIAETHVDFLLIRVDDCRPVLGIVLEDFIDQRPELVARDGFIRAVFSDCGLPLLSLPVRHVYNAATVRRLIYDVTPLNFPLSGIAEALATALLPADRGPRFREGVQAK
jgi:hypothetical protein